MGYVSPYAATGTTTPKAGGYVSPYANGVTAGGPPQPGHSVLGFLGNLIGGAKDMTIGLGKLIAAPAMDIARAGLEGLTLGKIDIPGGYATPQILKGLEGIPQDYWDRYSPLLPGGRPASQFLQELYDKPASFGMDILAAGGAAEGVAKAAGGGAIKAAEAAGELAPAAVREGVMGALEKLPISARTAEGASVRAGLGELAGGEPWYAKLLPEQKFVREGPNFNITTSARNPIERAITDAVDNKFGSETLQEFKDNIQRRAEAFHDTPQRTAAYVRREEALLKEAEDRGLTHISKPSIYTFRDTSTARSIRNIESGKWFTDRFKGQEAVTHIAQPALDQMDNIEKGASGYRSMDAHVLINGVVDESSTLVRDVVDNAGPFVKRIDLTDAPVPPLRDALAPEILTRAQAIVPDLQAEAAVRVYDDFIAQLHSPDMQNVPGWDIPTELQGALHAKDDIIAGVEHIASGRADPQAIMDIQFKIRDVLEHKDQFLNMQDTPDLMIERATRPTRAVNGIYVGDEITPIRSLTLKEAKQAHDLMLEHASTVGSIRRKADRIVASGRGVSRAERRAGVAAGMGVDIAEAPRLTEAALSRLEKRKALLEGKIKQYDQEIPLSAQGTHPMGNIAKNKRDVAELQSQLDEVNYKIQQGRRGPTKSKTLTPEQQAEALVRANPAGGLLPQFMAKGGVGGAEGMISTLSEEVRQVMGDTLGNKVLEGVTTVTQLRDRLHQLQVDPTALAGTGYMDVYLSIKAAREAAIRNGGEWIDTPGYFPMVDINRVKVSDWLKASPGSRGQMKAALDPHLKYNDQILLRRGTWLKDPLKARLIREARHARAEGTLRGIEAIVSSKLGRQIAPGDSIAPDERVISTDYLRHSPNAISKVFYDTRMARMQGGMDEAHATLEAIDESTKAAQDLIDSGKLDKTSMRMYAVPVKVADQLTAAARSAGIINGPTAKVYFQGPTNVWRALVLAGSPRWIVNNVLGNSVMSIMQGAPVIRAFHILEQRYKEILNKKYGWHLNTAYIQEIRKNLDASGVLEDVQSGVNYTESRQPIYIPGAETVPGPGGIMMMNARNDPGKFLSAAHAVGQKVRSLNSEIEDAFRMNSALTAAERLQGIGHLKRMMSRFSSTQDRMGKIFGNGLTEGAAQSVVREMNHFLGDFVTLGPWERNIIRPYVFPFWGFYKHVGKLLLSYPFEYPERAVVLSALTNITKEMTAQYGAVPSWLEGGLPLSPPGMDPTQYLMTAGPNPFSGLFESPLGQLAPIPKVIAEHFLGQSLFSGKPFSDKDTVAPYGSTQQYHIIRDANGKAIDVVPVGKVTPSLMESALQQIPQYEMLKSLVAGGQMFDTSGIIDALKSRLGMAGGGVIIDPATGQAKYPSSFGQTALKFAGFNVIPYDLGSFQTYLDTQKQAALTEAQKRAY